MKNIKVLGTGCANCKAVAKLITAVAEEKGIAIEDKGALDCAIRARTQTAVLRGAGAAAIDWEKLQ